MPFVEAGQPLKVKAGKRMAYTPNAQQLVAYVLDGGNWITVDASNLADVDVSKLHIGVGFDEDGDGVVDTVREIGPDSYYACNIFGIE